MDQPKNINLNLLDLALWGQSIGKHAINTVILPRPSTGDSLGGRQSRCSANCAPRHRATSSSHHRSPPDGRSRNAKPPGECSPTPSRCQLHNGGSWASVGVALYPKVFRLPEHGTLCQSVCHSLLEGFHAIGPPASVRGENLDKISENITAATGIEAPCV